MTKAVTFIETSIFTKQIQELATDDELKDFQIELIEQPEKGDLIQGSGGFRKARMALAGKGKSGGARIIYYLIKGERIYLVMAYPKSRKDTLTHAEKNQLKQLAKLFDGENK